MAVYWDVSKIKDHATVTTAVRDGVEKWHPLTMALVDACNVVKLTAITAKNFDEWLWRLAYLEAIGAGDMLNDWKDDKPITRNYTRAEIESHIGLATNWGSMTRTQFVGHCNRMAKRRADDMVTRGKYAAPKAEAVTS